ncbi:MAG: hypothetical protein JWM47_3258 [Acidimicrobiales bacterium]|nr:hypothetical protein [Acidimicrobiales bacterium]
MGVKKRHHVVSRGYQRFFAEGEQVLLIDKVPAAGRRRVRLAGTRDVFVRDHFNSHLEGDVLVPALEDEWQKVESRHLPGIRAWLDGEPVPSTTDGPGSRDSVRVLAALHFARSFAFNDVHLELAEARRTEALLTFPRDPELIRLWTEERGRPPTPDELASEIETRFRHQIGPHSAFAVNQMVSHFNKTLEFLGTLQVQSFTPENPRVKLILGDSPFVVARHDGSRVGSRDLALREADQLYLPLSPDLGVVFTSEPEGHGLLPASTVQHLNRLTWRASRDQVIAHPDTNLGLALRRATPSSGIGRNAPCPCGSGDKFKRCCTWP